MKATNSTLEVEPFVAGECLDRGPEAGGEMMGGLAGRIRHTLPQVLRPTQKGPLPPQ